MDRLTYRDEQGYIRAKSIGYMALVEKLAEYEDAEEQGLSLKLPCEIGDTVYCLYRNDILEDKVVDYDIWSIKDGLRLRLRLENCNDYVCGTYGKTVFLTREEAEQALMQMGE